MIVVKGSRVVSIKMSVEEAREFLQWLDSVDAEHEIAQDGGVVLKLYEKLRSLQ